ncbi:MAG: hypothetical protein COV46_04085 [Deltaproteobacteria bacterium CG11_big_fil_rev_8_21_14_0_20_49_13]|nr:MAG: hypothetical protein COV46_04085 [Deltaproteobacteria bacterium CG11_big_fil_rev_8_21_14_0_20_49_13]
MTILDPQQLQTFVSALQLSIRTKIKFISEDKNCLKIHFDSPPSSLDENFRKFSIMLNGDWLDNGTCYAIHSAQTIDWSKITLFLLLTRLDEKNIIRLVQIDKSFRDIATEKLGLSGPNIENAKDCAKIIFQEMEKQEMTNRALAESTGLTQVTISNFKAGKDIKLSNLIKIINVLGLDMKIS